MVLTESTIEWTSRVCAVVTLAGLVTLGLCRAAWAPSWIAMPAFSLVLYALPVTICTWEGNWRRERGIWMLAVFCGVACGAFAGMLTFDVVDALLPRSSRKRSGVTPPIQLALVTALAGTGWLAAFVLASVARWNWRLTRQG